MRSTQVLFKRTPLIKFLGRRTIPKVDHSPKPHPEAPEGLMPSAGSSGSSGAAASGPRADPVAHGSFATNSDLPARFRYVSFSEEELENINTGGASYVF